MVLSDLADLPINQQDMVIDNADPGTVRSGAWVAEIGTDGGRYRGLDYERLDDEDE